MNFSPEYCQIIVCSTMFRKISINIFFPLYSGYESKRTNNIDSLQMSNIAVISNAIRNLQINKTFNLEQ